MSTIQHMIDVYQFNRTRTLALLDKIEQAGDAQSALGWRPAVGRAHIAWQLTHIGITEELIASERLDAEKKARFAELVPRFKQGSVPDDDIPSLGLVRQVLSDGRERLLETLRGFTDDQLSWTPEPLKERKLTLRDVLHIVAWHEPHHQGQAHITYNLYVCNKTA